MEKSRNSVTSITICLMTVILTLVTADIAFSQSRITTCGTIEMGLDCRYFKPFSGGSYLLSNYGTFITGDTVLVSGTVSTAWCMTFQSAALLSNTICKAAIPCNGMCSPCCQGIRGNVNGLSVTDLSDLSVLICYLTGGGCVIGCPAAANVNGVGVIDLADLSALVSYLSGGGYTPPMCP